MLVFFKERLVFLAVPKTGTTAYHSALAARASMVITDPPDLKHAPLYRYDRFIRPIYEKVCNAELETLAVVREPVGWLGSWYRYRRRPFLDGQPNSTTGISFDDFVLGYLKGKRPAFSDVGSQVRFLQPRPGGAPVTHLFRHDEPEKLDAFLAERLGSPVRTRRENASPDMALGLSPDVEKRLRRKCAEEFELYEHAG